MLLGFLTLITALSISAVAIYYSVAGLVAIFAAAAIPIMIMGGVLEVAKLVTAVWLHTYWKQATWWLKTYLSTAVIVLMLITSMGIFGFLSKAHIEQTSASQESVAKVQQITSEIARQEGIRSRAEEQIKKLETTGSGADAQIQAQIDKEQNRIDNAYKRIQPAIDEQNKIIGSQAKLYQDELGRIDEQLATLQKYIDAGDKDSIKKAQAMIGARQDGAWGRNTAALAEEWKKGRQQARADLLTKIEQATNNPQARAAANEIKRLRLSVEKEIAESNKLINRLRTQVGKKDNAADIQKSIDEQNERVRLASSEIDRLTEEKYKLEGEYRKLEAEVGPVKYIAEFVYGEQADQNLLEHAVRWVIITIIFVFDPLAVLLLLAAQYTFEFNRKDDDGDRLRLAEGDLNENTRTENSETLPETDQTLPTAQDEESAEGRAEDDTVVVTVEESIGTITTEAPSIEVQEPEAENLKKKKPTEFLEGLNQEEKRREQEYNEKEKDENFTLGKHRWKESNPDKTLKQYKHLYIKGLIDHLPWEDQEKEDNYKVQDSYQQNGEQNDNTLFNKLKR